MNIDIDKMEKFIMARYGEGPMKEYSFKKVMIVSGIAFALLTIVIFARAYYDLLRMEDVDTHYFYWILALIPFIAILSIARAKSTIRKAGYSVKRYDAVSIKIAGVFGVVIVFVLNRGTVALFVAEMILGLLLVYGVTTGVYKLYLIRKYAPYFKDARLRRDSP